MTYAVLTDEGDERLRAAAADHFVAIDAVFADRLDGRQTAQLAELLGRLPGGELGGSCGID